MKIIYDIEGNVIDIKDYIEDGIFTKQEDIDRLNRIFT
jgi:hypothetical protein